MMSEADIRARIVARREAVNRQDVEGVIADLDEDVTIFELVPPLRARGIDAARRRAIEWFGTYRDGPYWEDGEITIEADGDVAFSHFLSRVTGTLVSGDAVDMWFRTTLGWRRREADWRIVLDHSSVPFDPESGKGRLDLKPQ